MQQTVDVEIETTTVVVLLSGSSCFSACAVIPATPSPVTAVDAAAETIAVSGLFCYCSSVAAATPDVVAFSNFILSEAPQVRGAIFMFSFETDDLFP